MEIYLSMTDHTKAQTVDSDLPFFCAYSLPAVALTIGPENWKLLKPTFETLAQDLQVGPLTSPSSTACLKVCLPPPVEDSPCAGLLHPRAGQGPGPGRGVL